MYVLFASLKFEACYISGQKGEIKVKNTISFLHTFFAVFVVFHQKICVFVIFVSLDDEESSFRNQILTIQKPELVTKNCQ